MARNLRALGRRAPPSNRSTESDSGTRSSPDPFSAVLPAIAALGAISSVASISWASQDNDEMKSRSRRKAGKALNDLESCCSGLKEIFRRFGRYPELFAGTGGVAASPLKFGVHGPRVGADEARVYQQIVNDTASMLVVATQNSFNVMCAVEDGAITAPEEVFFAFGEAQDRLNKLIQDRATLKEAVAVGGEVAEELGELVRKLKVHMME